MIKKKAKREEILQKKLDDLKERIDFQKKCYRFWISEAEKTEKEFYEVTEDNYEIDLDREDKLKKVIAKISAHLKKSDLEEAEMNKVWAEIEEFKKEAGISEKP